VERLFQDLRFAVRLLTQTPSFTLIAALSLGLGIGANAAIFSLVDALFLRALPVESPEQLVKVYNREEKNPGFVPLSHLNWIDYRSRVKSFAGILGYDWVRLSVTAGNEEPAMGMGQMVSENYFSLLGIRPVRGRLFSAEENREGAAPVAVASYRFWRERLGANPAALGKTVRVNGSPITVVGVMPERFSGIDLGLAPDLWMPMAQNKLIRTNPVLNWYNQRRGLFINTIGRLRPGVSLAAANAEMETIAAGLEREYPDENYGKRVRLVPLSEATINPGTRGIVAGGSKVLLVVVGLVLLISCANVANLLLARAAARRKEIAIRLSQGASRGRLIRQLLTESLLLSLLGAAVGLLLAAVAVRGLTAMLPALPIPVPLALKLGLDPRVMGFTLALAVATGLLFGLAPAIAASRPELVSALKNEAGGVGIKRGAGLLRSVLVVTQVALSVVALFAAGLFLRSLRQAQKVDLGFDSGKLAVLSFDLALQGIDPAQGEPLLDQLRERIASLPGVENASLAQAGPFRAPLPRSIYPEGAEDSDKGIRVQVNTVMPHYFETVGVPILRGRAFSQVDGPDAAAVMIVNQTMAERYWPGKEAVGKRIFFPGIDVPITVVGVARNSIYNNPGEEPKPFAYVPLSQAFVSSMTLLVRAKGDPAALLPTVQRETRAVIRGVPLVDVATVDSLMGQALGAPRLAAQLLGLFGLLALILSAIGLYGVLSYAIAQRAREIGTRMALGALRGGILALMLRQGLTLVAAGLALGLAGAWALSRFAAGLLIGVEPNDPPTFLGAALALTAVGFFATFIPARRATTVDPLVAMRYD
jgi:predicted permease